MNKNQLIAKLADTTGITKSQTDFLLENLINILNTESKVSIKGLGTFSIVKGKTKFKATATKSKK
jgi:nucleoid DNA-binding protein